MVKNQNFPIQFSLQYSFERISLPFPLVEQLWSQYIFDPMHFYCAHFVLEKAHQTNHKNKYIYKIIWKRYSGSKFEPIRNFRYSSIPYVTHKSCIEDVNSDSCCWLFVIWKRWKNQQKRKNYKLETSLSTYTNKYRLLVFFHDFLYDENKNWMTPYRKYFCDYSISLIRSAMYFFLQNFMNYHSIKFFSYISSMYRKISIFISSKHISF